MLFTGMARRGTVSPQSRGIKLVCKILKQINQVYRAFPQNDLSCAIQCCCPPGPPSHLPAEEPLSVGAWHQRCCVIDLGAFQQSIAPSQAISCPEIPSLGLSFLVE